MDAFADSDGGFPLEQPQEIEEALKQTPEDTTKESLPSKEQLPSAEQVIENSNEVKAPNNAMGEKKEGITAASDVKTSTEPLPKVEPRKSPVRQQQATQNDSVEEANDDIAKMLLENRITMHESSKLQAILRENAILKEKVAKLKTLLARSAKASKETKQENIEYKKLLDVAKKEVERLNDRVEALASRPTHMDLLADFETNFDRALMNLHTDEAPSAEYVRQTVGQATEQNNEEENVSNMLMAELNQTKSRVEHLENMNASLKKRSIQLEKQNEQLMQERQSESLKMSNLQLELKMAKMETENATRSMKEKLASLAEMQMEIDLVTKSAMDANARAAEGMEVAESAKSDKVKIEELRAKVSALQEWAIASSEAKEAVMEENRILEKKLAEYEKAGEMEDVEDSSSKSGKKKTAERLLWTNASSLVIGAGTLQSKIFELGENKVMDFETVILRWKFDITPSDTDIHFSILKGKHEDKKSFKDADAVFKGRVVVGGGGGEVTGAFARQNACTIVWSNEHSWVRPRAVKYSIEAFAIM